MNTTALDPAAVRARHAELTILDVRGDAEFARGHLPVSGHLPLGEMESRRNELPPRSVAMLVVAEDAARAAGAAALLEGYGYSSVHHLDTGIEALGDLAHDRSAAARLWRPAPFLEEVLPPLPRGRALDLACGAGRDSVFLALHGFDVTAVDVDEGALERTRALAARHGVAVETRRVDLERDATPLVESPWTLIVCFRFLHRLLLPAIGAALAPGGHLVYETFRVGQQRFGRPTHPRFLLEAGEMARAFAALEILRCEEPDPPGGPITTRLLARRPA